MIEYLILKKYKRNVLKTYLSYTTHSQNAPFFRASNWLQLESIFEYSLANLKNTCGQSRAWQPRAEKLEMESKKSSSLRTRHNFSDSTSQRFSTLLLFLPFLTLCWSSHAREISFYAWRIKKTWCIVNFLVRHRSISPFSMLLVALLFHIKHSTRKYHTYVINHCNNLKVYSATNSIFAFFYKFYCLIYFIYFKILKCYKCMESFNIQLCFILLLAYMHN